MPIYEYECPKCGEEKEYFAKFSEMDKVRKCHACKSRMKRLIGRDTGLVFNGDGWTPKGNGWNT